MLGRKRCACARYLVSVVAPRTGPILSVGAPVRPRCRTSKTAFEMPILYSSFYSYNIHSWIQQLPECEQGVRLSDERVEQKKSGVTGALSAIGDAIEAGTSGMIPSVESIGFESTLESVSRSGQTVEVVLRHKSESENFVVELDFDNPAKTATSMYESFVGRLV